MASRRRQRCILRHLHPAPALLQQATPAAGTPDPSARCRATPTSEVDIDTIVPLAPRTWTAADDPPGADQLGLSPEEIAQFKARGFVVKRGLVPRAALDQFVEECWCDAPPPLQRGDARTWLDVGAHWASLPDPKTEAGRSYRRLSHPTANSEWRYHALGFRPDFVGATSAHPNVLHMVEAPARRPRPEFPSRVWA